MVMKKNMKIKREEKEAPKPTKAERKKEAKSKLTKTGKIILVAIGVAAMLLSVTAMACSGILSQAKSMKSIISPVALPPQSMAPTLPRTPSPSRS